MQSFYCISSDELMVALIRQLRVRKVISGGRTVPEGTNFETLHKVATTLFPEKEFGDIITKLLKQGDIIFSGHLSLREEGSERSKYLGKGRVITLHPDAKVRPRQFFTENWTPISARFNSEGRRLYPNNNISHYTLTLDMVYIVSDGLPRSLQEDPVIYPVA